MQRAESFIVLRRKPVPVNLLESFLLNRVHILLVTGIRHLLLNYQHPFRDHAKTQDRRLYHSVSTSILSSRARSPYGQSSRFMEEVDREISEMKLSLNARARIVAESYLTAVRYITIPPKLDD